MAKFVFQLDGVLRQRASAEQTRQRALAEIQAQAAELDSQLRALDSAVRASEQDLRDNRLRGRIDMPYLAAHRRFAFAMQRKAMEIARKMAALQVQTDEARRNLLEATKARKIIEKLRDKQLQAWRDDRARRELAAMDEIGMQLALRELTEHQADQP